MSNIDNPQSQMFRDDTKSKKFVYKAFIAFCPPT